MSGDESSCWLEMFDSCPWVEMYGGFGGDNVFVWIAFFHGEG